MLAITRACYRIGRGPVILVAHAAARAGRRDRYLRARWAGAAHVALPARYAGRPTRGTGAPSMDDRRLRHASASSGQWAVPDRDFSHRYDPSNRGGNAPPDRGEPRAVRSDRDASNHFGHPGSSAGDLIESSAWRLA